LLVADDVDLLDARLGAFIHFEHEIDAVLVELDDLGLDGCRETALAAVELDDAGDIGADLGAREDLARGEPDLRPDLVFLQPLIALRARCG
jgi:hypothetical protein